MDTEKRIALILAVIVLLTFLHCKGIFYMPIFGQFMCKDVWESESSDDAEIIEVLKETAQKTKNLSILKAINIIEKRDNFVTSTWDGTGLGTSRDDFKPFLNKMNNLEIGGVLKLQLDETSKFLKQAAGDIDTSYSQYLIKFEPEKYGLAIKNLSGKFIIYEI